MAEFAIAVIPFRILKMDATVGDCYLTVQREGHSWSWRCRGAKRGWSQQFKTLAEAKADGIRFAKGIDNE